MPELTGNLVVHTLLRQLTDYNIVKALNKSVYESNEETRVEVMAEAMRWKEIISTINKNFNQD